jgi:hypothetical protein
MAKSVVFRMTVSRQLRMIRLPNVSTTGRLLRASCGPSLPVSREANGPHRRALARVAVPAIALARLRAVSGGCPRRSVTTAARRVRTGAADPDW